MLESVDYSDGIREDMLSDKVRKVGGKVVQSETSSENE